MALAWEINEVIAPEGISEEKCQRSTEGVYLTHTGLFPLTLVGWQFFLEQCLVPCSLSAGVFLLSEAPRVTPAEPLLCSYHITPILPPLHHPSTMGKVRASSST